MKPVYFAFLFSIIFLTKTSAQSFLKLDLQPKYFSFGTSFFVLKEKPFNGSNISISPFHIITTASLIASHNSFDIYQLPVDKMICLVPDKRSVDNMNVLKQPLSDKMAITDKMPNPIKLQNWIPKEPG
jgi:hypothetical protein